MNDRHHLIVAVAGLLLAACSSDDDSGTEAPNATETSDTALSNDGDISADGVRGDGTPDSEAGLGPCERGSIEPDLMAPPLAGSGVRDGVLPPGEYLISSTYLQLGQDADAQQLFQTLIGPVVTDLESRSGLLALSLGSSASCGTARTLAVWQDDAAMIAFVTSPAHGNAMANVTDMSRGGSVVTHWVGGEGSANWSNAALQLAADDGPFY